MGQVDPGGVQLKAAGAMGWLKWGIQGVEGQVRVSFLALQGRIGRKLGARERIVIFIPEYAEYLMNRLEVGKDGKVAYDRAKSQKPKVLGVEFGEKLLYKVSKTDKQVGEDKLQVGVRDLGRGKEEEWGGMGCCRRQGFKCKVCEKDTSGTEVEAGLHFMG